MQMAWFGGSRMHEDSRILRRLMRVLQSSSEHDTLDSTPQLTANGVVLWCRQYDTTKKTFGPYVCMGRVGYVSHVAQSLPVRFTLKLLDFDELISNDTTRTIQAMFAN